MEGNTKSCSTPPHLTNVPDALIIPPEMRNPDKHKIKISTIPISRERLGRMDSEETIARQE
jgi:hypothetical protein